MYSCYCNESTTEKAQSTPTTAAEYWQGFDMDMMTNVNPNGEESDPLDVEDMDNNVVWTYADDDDDDDDDQSIPTQHNHNDDEDEDVQEEQE